MKPDSASVIFVFFHKTHFSYIFSLGQIKRSHKRLDRVNKKDGAQWWYHFWQKISTQIGLYKSERYRVAITSPRLPQIRLSPAQTIAHYFKVFQVKSFGCLVVSEFFLQSRTISSRRICFVATLLILKFSLKFDLLNSNSLHFFRQLLRWFYVDCPEPFREFFRHSRWSGPSKNRARFIIN